MRPIARAVLLATLTLACRAGAQDAREDARWNGGAIAWRPYEAGLAEARSTGKPVCLLFVTTWCPHCRNFARVFSDARVVGAAQKLVMIRVDKDRHPDISRRYALDGEYIPRTYFLSPQGEVWANIQAPHDEFRYFYDEDDPRDVLKGMQAALKRAKR